MRSDDNSSNYPHTDEEFYISILLGLIDHYNNKIVMKTEQLDECIKLMTDYCDDSNTSSKEELKESIELLKSKIKENS